MELRGEVGFCKNVWSQRYASWKKKAIMHERPGKTMSEKLPNQTFQTESGMISRTGETSETSVLAPASCVASALAWLRLSPRQVEFMRRTPS